MAGTVKLGATGGQILFSTSGTSGLGTPATGYGSLYYGTDSQLRLMTDTGAITILGAGGGTGSGSSGTSGVNGLGLSAKSGKILGSDPGWTYNAGVSRWFYSVTFAQPFGSSNYTLGGIAQVLPDPLATGDFAFTAQSSTGFTVRVLTGSPTTPPDLVEWTAIANGETAVPGTSGTSGNSGAGITYGAGSVTTNVAGSVNGTALDSNTTGAFNIAFADNALTANTIGQGNVAIGYNALAANTTGSYNTGIGIDTLSTITTSSYHVAIGYEAGKLTTNPLISGVTAIGAGALRNNTTGDGVAIGTVALYTNTTGSTNVGIGDRALQLNTFGNYNIAIGRDALNKNTTGASNTGIGYATLYNNQTGSNNTAIGHQALQSATGAVDNNTAIGYQAGLGVTTGDSNTMIGAQAGISITTGSNNIILGATGGTAGMANTFAYYNDANNYLTINSGAIVTATNTSNRYIPIVIGGATYKLLLSI